MVFIGSDETIRIDNCENEVIDFFISVASYWQCSQVVLNSMIIVGIVLLGNSYFELSIDTIDNDLSKAIFSFTLSTARNFATVLFPIHATSKTNEIDKHQSNRFLILNA